MSDGQTSLLLNESYASELLHFGVGAPVVDKFDRPLVSLARGDSSVDVAIYTHS
jgi:hypothetical protein